MAAYEEGPSQPLLNYQKFDDDNNSQGIVVDESDMKYEPILECKEKFLFGLLPTSPRVWAMVKIFFEVVGLISFVISASSVDPKVVSVVMLHVLISFIVSPLWQNLKGNSDSPVPTENGCLICVGLVNMIGMGKKHNDTDLNDREITRYIPFSIYNTLFMVLYPNQELNSQLPEARMERFGMGRALLLIYATAARGSLNLAIFSNAVYVLGYRDEFIPKLFAIIGLVLALIDLRVYFVSLFFGVILYPYMLVVTFALYFPVCRDILNPPNGSLLFKILAYYWKLSSSVDS